MTTPRHPALTAIGRHGLPGPVGPIRQIGEDDSAALVHVLRRDRLLGLAAAALRSGAVTAPVEVVGIVDEAWHEQLAACVDLERLLLGVARTLDDAGADWRLTKGSALAHLDYSDPALRTFGDLDVLVHPDSWGMAVAALDEAGWRREEPELAPLFDDRFGKGVTLKNEESLEVDLHRRLAIGRFGLRLDTEALFREGDDFGLADRRIPALSGPGRLLHACFHAALGGWSQLRAFRDVAQLLLVSRVDWEVAVDTANRHRVEAVVAYAIAETWTRLELEHAHDSFTWARRQRIGRLDRQALEVFAREAPFRTQALTALPVLLGRGAFRYAWELAVKPGRRPRR